MGRMSTTTLSLLVFGALLCGGCGMFSGAETDSLEQAKLARIKANLPFSVSVDGAKAATATEICAKIERPVPNNAELILGTSNDDVIVISFFPCDQDGVVVSGGKPSLIILRGSSKVSLDSTLDKKPLKSGYQLMRITAGDKAASVLLDLVQSKNGKINSAKTGKK
ncbi:MAG: hypothetical protein GXP32_05715 [Kiritimatiellaeota bacterium]|nr:hypothetical protein [Kiritimatiellota bacterium]